MLWILPGFLGQESDFEFIEQDHQVIPLFKKQHPLNLKKNKNQWVDIFVESVKKQNHSQNILMGYSFGGRLGIEVIKQYPKLFDQSILISCNPINLENAERKPRAQHDAAWAQKFVSQNWQQTLELWNQQSVFSSSNRPQNREKNYYSLEAIGLALTEYSLANQHLSPLDLRAYEGSLLWLFGELDKKYINISKKMQISGWRGKFLHIENAGHRLYLDNTKSFLSCIGEFLANKKEML